MKPKFIVIEGPDGVGKSTLIKGLEQRLRHFEIPVRSAHNPRSTAFGQKCILPLFSEELGDLDPNVEAMMMMAGHLQITQEIVIPSLQAERSVLLDRYLLSTMAYQGYARRRYLGTFIPWTKRVVNLPSPDLTVVLLANMDVLKERIARKTQKDNFDGDEVQLRDTLEAYRKAESFHEGKLVKLLTDDCSEEETLDLTWSVLLQAFPDWQRRAQAVDPEPAKEELQESSGKVPPVPEDEPEG